MTDQTINPGDWVRLGHTQYPDFRLEGTVRESSTGSRTVGWTQIGSVADGMIPGYTILEHKPGEPDWANDRAIVDGDGRVWVRGGVKWRVAWGDVIGSVTFTTAEIAERGPITRIDPRKQS